VNLKPRSGVVAGVDGCPGGWVVATSGPDDGPVTLRVVTHISEVLLAAPLPDVVAVDIPIGLPDAGPRECDLEARTRLGRPRSSSVFPAPIRPALSATTYREACDIRYRIEGKRYSQQTWQIFGKIREVDRLMTADPSARRIIREAHPELCFRELAGGKPMAHSKKTAEGRRERYELLAGYFGARMPATRLAGASADDILDALVELWSAGRIAAGVAERIPSSVPTDSKGLPMGIWF
jgi:predicted RNase H-like nuclease